MSKPHFQSVYAANSPSAQVSCFTFLFWIFLSAHCIHCRHRALFLFFFASFCPPIAFTVNTGLFFFTFQNSCYLFFLHPFVCPFTVSTGLFFYFSNFCYFFLFTLFLCPITVSTGLSTGLFFTFQTSLAFSFFASFCLPIEFTVHAGFLFVFQSRGTEGSLIST